MAVLLGGALLGVGFGLTGYCPGTGLACTVTGRIDALITVLGMVLGALVFIWIYPSIVQPIDAIANHGKAVLPDITGIPRTVWVIVLVGGGGLALVLTRPKKM